MIFKNLFKNNPIKIMYNTSDGNNIYIVLIFNGRSVRWEVFNKNDIIQDIIFLLNHKFNLNKFHIEINGMVILKRQYGKKISSFYKTSYDNGIDVRVFTKLNIKNLPF
tara:strand:- start:135 stop:458 length:324 start_codon:yes stop_codon:yes gene_type:complete